MDNNIKKMSIKVSNDQLRAYVHLHENKAELTVTASEINDLLEEENIVFGIKQAAIHRLVHNLDSQTFPFLIAEGTAPVAGDDGQLKHLFEVDTTVDRSEGWDFREVMRIPTIQSGDKIATLIEPTKGSNGITVYGIEITATDGKPLHLQAGENVAFDEQEATFYATANGEISFGRSVISVYTVYEVNESISMKIGNIDFVGSVIIRGDVPTGFTVKASGDIKIFGLVEAASIISGKSIFISEGISGMQTGLLQAEEDINVGYVNQAKLRAGNDIYVENSILHSDCIATHHIVCERGNLIGGTIQASKKIVVRNTGNKINTATHIQFQEDERTTEEQSRLEQERTTLKENIQKISLLKDRIGRSANINEQMQATLNKVNRSYEQMNIKIRQIEAQLNQLETTLGNNTRAKLEVNGKIFPNVTVGFGRYKQTLNQTYQFVSIHIDRNEIVITPL